MHPSIRTQRCVGGNAKKVNCCCDLKNGNLRHGGPDEGFPTWCTCTPLSTFAYLIGVHLMLALEGKNIFKCYNIIYFA